MRPIESACARYSRIVAHCIVICLAQFLGVEVGFSTAAEMLRPDSPEVKQSVAKLQNYLKGIPVRAGGRCSLVGLALAKSDIPRDSQVLQSILATVTQKFSKTDYSPVIPTEGIYEAAVDAMLLEEVDSQKYRPQLEILGRYFSLQLRDYGMWQYPTSPPVIVSSDMSVSQYAVLGLWACDRAGVEIPPEVWDRSSRGILASQNQDGGFAYRPAEKRVSYLTMSAAGASTVMILQTIIHSDANGNINQQRKKFGVLENIVADPPTKPARIRAFVNPVPSVKFDESIERSVSWVTPRYEFDKNLDATFPMYYYMYTIERMATLMGVEQINGTDWYDSGAKILLKRQAENGGISNQWGNGGWGDAEGINSSFSLLFLTRATAKMVGIRPTRKLVGGGLLAGGRGLPNDLNMVEVKGSEVKTRKSTGSLDSFLSQLEKPQADFVLTPDMIELDKFQAGDPKDLIVQRDRVVKLLKDPRPDARKVAVWAIGQMDDLRLVSNLILALNDSDTSVVQEASVALCALTRKPGGIQGVPIDPLEGVTESATEPERIAAIDKWRKSAVHAWRSWYLRNRPYDERDTRMDLPFEKRPSE